MSHMPRKRFGQHFLEDAYVISQILAAIAAQPHDNLLEIGPGLGAITRPLLQQVTELKAIEIDVDLHQYLVSLPEATHRLKLLCQDVLQVDFSTFGQKLRVVGNLPYNISTPLLFHLLEYTTFIQDMHFMLQKEVVDRLSAAPGGKSYGRLSVMVQAQCQVEPLFIVPPSAFHPPPQVDSAVVRITPHTDQYPKSLLLILEKLLIKAFSTRRKTLSNCLKPLLSVAELEALAINPSHRPETLSVEIFIKMATYLEKSCKLT